MSELITGVEASRARNEAYISENAPDLAEKLIKVVGSKGNLKGLIAKYQADPEAFAVEFPDISEVFTWLRETEPELKSIISYITSSH